MNKPDKKSLVSEQEASVARSREFRVGASPFNTVKFDLGVLLVIGVLVWLLIDRMSEDLVIQLMVLAGYGLASMLWIIFHTRRILHQITKASHPGIESDK
jgi:hypothetical protein